MTDWTPELADDDIEVLMEALEAWEVKDAAGELVTGLVDSMLERNVGAPPPHVVEKLQREKSDRELAKRTRKERSVLLRAKLITIRDRRRAERMTREALA